MFNLKCSFDPISQGYHFETCHKLEISSPLKQNEPVLSSQALNVGRSLGIITQKSSHIDAVISVSISLINITTLKVIYKRRSVTFRMFQHGEIYFRHSCLEYHVYKDVWKSTIGKKLHAEQELDNAVDKFAVKVVKNNEWPLTSRVLMNCVVFYRTWWEDMHGSDWPSLQTAVRRNGDSL